jgi:hypothetical protein
LSLETSPMSTAGALLCAVRLPMNRSPTRGEGRRRIAVLTLELTKLPAQVVQFGQAWHEPHCVLVELVLLQIWTPGPPRYVQRRTSCSRQGQYAEMFSFHAHSFGDVLRQVELLSNPQTGTTREQSLVLPQATPPQCSTPRGGGTAAPHWVRGRDRAMPNSNVRKESVRF